MTVVRPAVISDAQIINAIASELGYESSSDDKVQEWLTELLESGNDRVWVCDLDSSVVGWLHAFRSVRLGSAPFVEIAGLAVSLEFRKMGAGGALVDSAVAWARSQGVKIKVRCNSSRTDAHSFYQSVGFSKVKSQLVFEGLS